MRLAGGATIGKSFDDWIAKQEFVRIALAVVICIWLGRDVRRPSVAGPGAVLSWARCLGRRARWRRSQSSRAVGYLGQVSRWIKDGVCWQGTRDQRWRPFARGPQSGFSGVEEQRSWLCLAVYSMIVYLGTDRAGLVLNQTGRRSTGSPGGDDGEVVATLVRMKW